MKETPKRYIKKKQPSHKMYKRSNIGVAVAEYQALQHTLQEVTFRDLEKKYKIPEAKIRGYYHKDTGMPLLIGRRPFLRAEDEDKLEKYLITCSDRGYGKNRT